MRKIGFAVVGLAMAGTLAGGGVALAASGSPHITRAETIRVHEHNTKGKFFDTDKSGQPSPGDVFLFASTFTNPTSHKRVGGAQGRCTIMFADAVRCEATGTLNGRGTVEVAGTAPNDDDFDLAITGGTGDFQNARGQLHIHNVGENDSVDTLYLIP